jgi:hypothetical protein
MARALFVATCLTATPASACAAMSVDELAARLPGIERFELGAAMLPAFLALWTEHAAQPLPAAPDGVALFAPAHRPFLAAFRRAGCLLALLPITPAALWRALRQQIGPIA